MKRFFMGLCLVLTAHSGTFAASNQPAYIVSESDSQSETYIGSIEYKGGLLVRGSLSLPEPQDIQFLRFDIPDFCKAEIFEAGTVTEGVADLAERVSGQNIYAVNGGRGTRVRSVFLSLNGPEQAGCHVLVFKRASGQPVPQPGHPEGQAVTCVVNEINAPMVARVTTDGRILDFVAPPQRTSVLLTTLRPDRSIPSLLFSLDTDMSPGYDPHTFTIAAMIQGTVDCDAAPTYVIRARPFSNFVDFMRLR